MNFNKILYTLVLAVLIGLWACTSQKVNQTSTDRLYKKENNELSARYVVYHINDSISQLFYEISNEALIYKKTDTSNYFYSQVKVLVKTSNEDDLNTTLDTASVIIRDRQTDAIVKQLRGEVYFKLRKGFNYYIDINVIDINKKTIYTHSEYSNKSSVNSRQNFLVTNSRNDILFSSYYKPDDVVYVQSLRNKEKLYEVDFFKPNFKLAIPPFSLEQMPRFSYKPDSVFSVYESNGRVELALPQKGFFHLKTNNDTKDGVTFFVYESSYPKIKNTEQMILATRYMMAKKEFDNCMQSSDKKGAIDKFWLDIAGSNERAKELIRKYYGRVQEANKLFTSYQEGWKTDRGMIYIVFGAPNKVSKRKNGEMWTYGETGNPHSIVFSFIKVVNPFTDNDYYLERNEMYKAPWYEAVDMWRQGRIYLDN
ncbi:MAG: GWxTD domain-containing protein [Bacteroidetes bacterium]|nr:GWxTD domain-containing protein [Bacteroidota bacterium]